MSLIIDIKVVPSSGKQLFKIDKSKKIKCLLKNPPEKGKANAELIDLIAKKLKVPKDKVFIVSGETSRNKRICINSSLMLEDVYEKLGIEQQTSI